MLSRPLPALVLAFSTMILAAACDSAGSGPAVPLVCAADGASCQDDTGCCSFRCVGGSCAVPLNACLEANTSCISGGQCCSSVCAQDGYCSVLGAPGTCAPIGTACRTDAECCSSNCNDTTNACHVGLACADDFVACTFPQECCSRNCDGQVCQPSTCVPQGGACARDHQCCVGLHCQGGACGP